jgi:acyl phosphate:glycerol-3-phosphate acyltransferase
MTTGILIAALIGYVLGAIPFGFLAARAKGIDIRQHGSGNIGATNVWRVCGWRFGLPVFILDALKGVVSVWVGKWMVQFSEAVQILSIASAAGCIIGHSFPVWLKFKGGKGVATSLGVMIGLMPLASLIAFALWAVVFKVSGYVSLASIVAAVALPTIVGVGNVSGWNYGWPPFWFALVAGLLVIIRHKSNIARLRAGTESRFGKKKGGEA